MDAVAVADPNQVAGAAAVGIGEPNPAPLVPRRACGQRQAQVPVAAVLGPFFAAGRTEFVWHHPLPAAVSDGLKDQRRRQAGDCGAITQQGGIVGVALVDLMQPAIGGGGRRIPLLDGVVAIPQTPEQRGDDDVHMSS